MPQLFGEHRETIRCEFEKLISKDKVKSFGEKPGKKSKEKILAVIEDDELIKKFLETIYRLIPIPFPLSLLANKAAFVAFGLKNRDMLFGRLFKEDAISEAEIIS